DLSYALRCAELSLLATDDTRGRCVYKPQLVFKTPMSTHHHHHHHHHGHHQHHGHCHQLDLIHLKLTLNKSGC
ncbi:unnamed protein product, partial [Ceratitis capitata]